MVWCPKYRRKVLVGAVGIRLKEIIQEVAKGLRVGIIEMQTDKDHIHILAGIDPSFGVMEFIKTAKGRSSKILRQESTHLRTKLSALWTHSCFTTAGGVPLNGVKQYIENQQNSNRPKQKEKWKNHVDSLQTKALH
ncbi:IS200/IS605 family transposase [Helicobacter acinonychis]|uniref:IS200/IS605 family transposase n=1 Tax=Helicobacter acinonychis TaxID=212 RepID=UPI001CD8BE45|nr:IS200/IS605 family transposase [Helicobacter acinonychis]